MEYEYEPFIIDLVTGQIEDETEGAAKYARRWVNGEDVHV